MSNEQIYLQALRNISALWPEPPNCADIMSVNGINDGRSRAIIADSAIRLARSAIARTTDPQEAR